MSLNILFLSSDLFPPSRVDVKVLFAEELVKRGHRIDWLLQSEKPSRKARVEEYGGGRAWVGANPVGSGAYKSVVRHILGFLNDLTLIGLVRRGQYDVVVIKDKFVAAALMVVVCKFILKIRTAYWLSWPFPEEYIARSREPDCKYPRVYKIRGTVFRWLLYKVIMPNVTHNFVQSQQMKTDVIAEGIHSGKVTPVPMGIDDRDIRQGDSVPTRKLLPVNESNFMYLGILSRLRQLDILIRVLDLVRQDIPGAKLYLVGQGESNDDEELIRRETKRLQLEGAVVMTGQQPREIALQYAREADVCISPFAPIPILNSTSPTKLVEYMALGRPVVANDHPEQRQVIRESGAGLCVAWDEREFADAIILLLKDKAMSAKMAELGPAYVKRKRTYHAIADLVEGEFLKLLSKPLKSGCHD